MLMKKLLAVVVAPRAPRRGSLARCLVTYFKFSV